MGLNFLEISGQDLTIAQTGNPAKVEMLVNPIVETAGSGGEANPDLIPQDEAEAGTATTERVISAERLAQAITALASSSPEILDTLFRIVDSISGYKQIFDTSELTVDRGITLPNFDFVFSNHFDSSGNVYATKYKMDNSITLKNTASNRLDFGIGGAESIAFRFYSSVRFQMHSNCKITWGTGYADGTRDTTIGRLEEKIIGLNGGISYTSLSADPSDPADGSSVTWVSDGTDSGDAGDVMLKINIGGTVKITTLIDYSTL